MFRAPELIRKFSSIKLKRQNELKIKVTVCVQSIGDNMYEKLHNILKTYCHPLIWKTNCPLLTSSLPNLFVKFNINHSLKS